MSEDTLGIVNGITADSIQAYARHTNPEMFTGDNYSFVEEDYQPTGAEIREIKRQVDTIKTVVETIQEDINTGRASPENLYRVVGGDQSHSISDNLILKIRDLLQEALTHLDRAYSEFDEEIERESEIDLFFGDIRNISFFPIKNANFEDAITLLLVSLQSNIGKTYSRNKVIALKEVVAILIDNIILSEHALNECEDKLEESGFDLTFPLKGVQFDDLL